MSAGAVACAGMILASGVKNKQTRNNAAVTKAVRPVLPPSATPEADSTNVVTVEVPSIAPVQVAIESQSIDFSMPIGSPFSSSIPACAEAP